METTKKLGIVKVKSDITKFTEIMARDYELEAFEVTGILAQVLIEWQKRELIESNIRAVLHRSFLRRCKNCTLH